MTDEELQVKSIDLRIQADEIVEVPVPAPVDFDHAQLDNRDAEDAHPIGAITGLNEHIAKLEGIEPQAQVNVIERVARNGVVLPVSDKLVDIAVPEDYGYKLSVDEQGRIYLHDPADNVLSYIDTNIERIIKSGSYDATTQEIVLVTDDGSEIRVPVAGLVDVYYADDDTVSLIDRTFSLSPTSKQTLSNSITHIADKSNPHAVTKAQVGLGNVDNTRDTDKPVSTAQQAALDGKTDVATFQAHLADASNPHKVTKAQVGLSEVDNTSDEDKPVSTAQRALIDTKQDVITGAATTILAEDLAVSRVLVSDASGKVSVSGITPTELSMLDGAASNLQAQVDSKQATVTGAATSITDANLTASRVLVSDGSGKVAASGLTSAELLMLQGVTGNVQDMIDGKVDAQAGKGLSANDFTDAEKSKLAGIAAGAQVNVLESVSVNGSTLAVTSKGVNVTVPTKVSDLSNDLAFIDNSVTDLLNYYTKAQVYTKAEVADLMAGIEIKWSIVQALPSTGDAHTIYFVPRPGATDDSYNEYVYVNAKWELIGTTAFVLTVDQDAAGITINGTALQDASATQDGLMTTAHVATLAAKADASAVVPNSRTVNGHALSADVVLDADDVGALPVGTHIPDDVTIEQTFKATSTNPPSCAAIYDLIYEAGESIGLQTHVADTSNPHQVTKAQVGLGNCDNTADADKPISTATQAALDGKVDAVDGMGLSQANFTTTEKTKLSGIASGAQVNVLESVKVNGTALTISGKAVNVTVPTDNASLANGAGYQTASDVATAISGKADSADLTAHVADTSNPHNVTKTQIGLGNVDNTADTAKPISTATQTALNGKVDKVTGMTLTHNDLTDTLYTKLSELYTKAEIDALISAIPKFAVQVVDSLPTTGISDTTVYMVPNGASGNNARDEYIHVDGAWELIGSTQFTLSIVQNASGISINGTALQSAATGQAGLMTASHVSALAAAATSSALSAHTGNTSNPHSVTKAQVGLGNCDNTSDADKPVSDATQTALDGKVDKVSGKGLSTNDYTTAEKTKLAGIETGAEVNIIEAVQVNGTALTPSSKTVNVTVPTKVSALTNDSGYQTSAQVSTAITSALEGRAQVRRYTLTGNGTSTSLTASHDLGAIPAVMVFKGGELYFTDTTVTSTAITLSFNTAPASGTYFTVVAIG